MMITKEQIELVKYIVENKDNLEAILNAASMEKKQVKDLRMGESVTFAGITWSKFAEDEDGNAYMLADDIIGSEAFGESNDWTCSPIRAKTCYGLISTINEELGEDALVSIETDLFSHDGLRDYGTCRDEVSLLSYDLYRNNRSNIKPCEDSYWLVTPNSTPSGYGSGSVRCVGSGGRVCCDWYYDDRGVRPFCILKSSIFVSLGK